MIWLRDKDYFVLTTNVDHCFQKAGFDKQPPVLSARGLRGVSVQRAMP